MGNTFVEINEKLSDNELIEKINNGEYELLHIIIKRYNSVILHYVDKYCSDSIKEDAIQEASFALYSAVKVFSPDKSSFNTFATLCIKRALFSYLRSFGNQKNIPSELLSSIEDVDIADSNSPEKIFFDKEDLNALKNNIKLELSPLEFKVLQLYLADDSYQDIAKKLDLSEKSVNNALFRIRKKLKR
jgi:RNA polymerase sporulation-specific sigma factor